MAGADPAEGKGGAAGGSGKHVSRRKGKEAAAPPGDWKSFARKHASTAVFVVVVLIILFVNMRDGGAPQGSTATGSPRAAVEGWSVTALYPDGTDAALCRHPAPCDPDVLWAAHASNATCQTRTTVWLGSGSIPVVSRDISVALDADLRAGDFSGIEELRDAVEQNDTGGTQSVDPGLASLLNLTTTKYNASVDWDGGWWWRAESERIALTIEGPCDAHSIAITLDLHGKTLTGGDWSMRQTATVTLHEEFTARLQERMLQGAGNKTK